MMTSIRPSRRSRVLAGTAATVVATAVLATTALATTGLAAAAARPAAGRNLVVNARGMAGDVSARGWDAVTIPGWSVAGGLPTVVRYGTRGFPRTSGRWPASRGRLFAGGAGGPAALTERVALRLPSGRVVPPGARYRVSAWLGGTQRSWASLRVTF